ncbi:MAG: imidazole glycerol phosphate synthase subunit HisH [Rhodospirillales bacterium]|nr:imidazole glycerol phosphate synthase subunit HisH [Rhodospirillales bacterium]
MPAPIASILDYDCGNLRSLERAFVHVGAQVRMIERAEDVATAGHLVLPGVGAYGQAMDGLSRRGYAEAVAAHAAVGKPLLGICLGMQLLFDESEEFGPHKGLGLVPGRVQMFDKDRAADHGVRIPHIGWTAMRPGPTRSWADTILADVRPDDHFYFVHSFHGRPADPNCVLAEVDYNGERICAAVHRDNVIGFQFHPEKSADAGLAILSRFVGLR